MESRLSRSPFHEFFFFTMELWLSRRPFHEFFFFTMELWLSQSPFHEFFFFTMEFWLSRSLSHELFPFHDGILAIKEPFTRTFSFSRWNSQNARFGGRLFSYIYITKGIYIGSASLKTLPLDLEPPLQEKSTVLLILMRPQKRKLLFFPEITYRHVIRLF
jgi:hypothetical protein